MRFLDILSLSGIVWMSFNDDDNNSSKLIHQRCLYISSDTSDCIFTWLSGSVVLVRQRSDSCLTAEQTRQYAVRVLIRRDHHFPVLHFPVCIFSAPCMSRVSTRCMRWTICTNRLDAVIYARLNVMSKWFRLQQQRRSFTAGDALSTSLRVSHPTGPLS